MNNIVPEAPYDAATTYAACPAGQTIDETIGRIEVQVQSNGDVYFHQDNDNDYDWGVTAGSGQTGNTKQCFDSTATYQARLSGNGGSNGNIKSPDGYLQAEYTGNFLNWYFANTALTNSDNFGIDGRQKTGTNTRMEIAKTAAVTLVNSMDNTRLGLATYNGSTGALIREGLDDIANNKANVISAINGITGSGSTPIAEAMEEIGRYRRALPVIFPIRR